MESALLSASAILPLQNKWQSSFYGKGICNGVLVRRSISYAGRRSPLTVSSVLGRKVKKVKKVKKETIVPDPDYRIPVVLLGAAGSLIYTDNLLAAAPIGLLGLLLLFQLPGSSALFTLCFLYHTVTSRIQKIDESSFSICRQQE